MIPVSPLPVPRARRGRAQRSAAALVTAAVWVAVLTRHTLPYRRTGGGR